MVAELSCRKAIVIQNNSLKLFRRNSLPCSQQPLPPHSRTVLPNGAIAEQPIRVGAISQQPLLDNCLRRSNPRICTVRLTLSEAAPCHRTPPHQARTLVEHKFSAILQQSPSDPQNFAKTPLPLALRRNSLNRATFQTLALVRHKRKT